MKQIILLVIDQRVVAANTKMQMAVEAKLASDLVAKETLTQDIIVDELRGRIDINKCYDIEDEAYKLFNDFPLGRRALHITRNITQKEVTIMY